MRNSEKLRKLILELDLMRRFSERKSIRQERSMLISQMMSGQEIDTNLIEPLARQFERIRLMNRLDLMIDFDGGTESSRRIFEAIINSDDRLPRRFLYFGNISGQAVGRIVVRETGSKSYGTGFLIGPQLIVTNNHVLPTFESARHGTIELGLWERKPLIQNDYSVFRLRPDDFFYTNQALDFSLVSIESTALGGRFASDYGKLKLLPVTGKALIGERVNIIQHGEGKPQSISIRDNTVIDVFDQWIHYTSDTTPGSSGAPVFNDDWQLVAIHHASIEQQTNSGKTLSLNEGVRISAVLADLKSEFFNMFLEEES